MTIQLPNPQSTIADGMRNPMSREWRQFIETLVKSIGTADDALSARVSSIESPEDWHIVGDPGEPAFLNGWVNYSASYNQCSFRKLHDGSVHVRGMIKNGSGASSNIFQLPSGYRPNKNTYSPACSFPGTANVSLLINATGNIQFITGGSTTYCMLDGCMFWTD